MASPLNVGLVGFGNIGVGVVRALAANRDLINGRIPHPIRVLRITDVDTTTRRDAPYDKEGQERDSALGVYQEAFRKNEGS